MESNEERFEVKVPDGFKLNFGKFGNITQLEAPEMKFDKYREVRIDYTESLGEAHKSIGIETYLTAEEIMAMVGKMMGVDA